MAPMEPSIQNHGTTDATSGLADRWVAAFLWSLPTLTFLSLCFSVTGLYILNGGLDVADPWINVIWLLILIPAAPLSWVCGKVQELILRFRRSNLADGWTIRTLIGAELGLLGYILVLWLLRALYYGGPIVGYYGIFIVGGDQVEVAATIAGWALAGALLGAVQGWARDSGVNDHPGAVAKLRNMLSWSLANAAGWAAGAVASWTLFHFFVISYEPICISCILRQLLCAGIAALVIAVAGGLSLLNRPISITFSVLIGLVAVWQLAYSPTPIFSPRTMHPAWVLETDTVDGFVESIAFSDSGAFLAASKSEKLMGENVSEWVVLWRTSDWKEVGMLVDGVTQVEGPPGESIVAEITPLRDKVYIRRKSDGTVLHSITFNRLSRDKTAGGYVLAPPSGFKDGGLTAPSGDTIVMDPHPVNSWTSPNDVYYNYSPDGRYIAAGYMDGGIWVWQVP